MCDHDYFYNWRSLRGGDEGKHMFVHLLETIKAKSVLKGRRHRKGEVGMSNTNPVPRIYRAVIEDVIKNVKEAFLNEGVDEQVLQELKQLWESKLLQSRAIDFMPSDVNVRVSLTYPHNIPQQISAINQDQQQAGSSQERQASPVNTVQYNPITTQGQQVVYVSNSHLPTLGNVGPMSGAAAQAAMALQNASGPSGTTLLGHQLSGFQPGQVIRVQQGSLPPGQQAHLFQSFQPGRIGAVSAPRIIYTQQPPQQQHAPQKVTKSVVQVDGTNDHIDSNTEEKRLEHLCLCNTNLCTCQLNTNFPKNNVPKISKRGKVKFSKTPVGIVLQVDGANDSSSDEFDDEEDEDFDNYPVTALGGAQSGPGEAEAASPEEEEEPLNSEDDVSDDDPSDLFDTDNVVVCQYDKIARVRNRWKFHLKDGIMNLKNKDYVFHKANGDSEW